MHMSRTNFSLFISFVTHLYKLDTLLSNTRPSPLFSLLYKHKTISSLLDVIQTQDRLIVITKFSASHCFFTSSHQTISSLILTKPSPLLSPNHLSPNPNQTKTKPNQDHILSFSPNQRQNLSFSPNQSQNGIFFA